MKSIFNIDDKNDIINRIDQLHPDSKPLWGKMSVSQMLAHCIVPAQISTGDIPGKRNLFGILFGKLAKKRMVSDEPFKKNLPTDPSFVIKHSPDFYESQQTLKALIEKLYNTNKTELVQRKHPFFGKMTIDEWGLLNYKHFDHHLRQFGV
ncbi:MAG: DUF1569 domain-containing protein [Parafilimonas sp.]|nr:DUF1569 domain-containing protein [Parafilimonas sp.]